MPHFELPRVQNNPLKVIARPLKAQGQVLKSRSRDGAVFGVMFAGAPPDQEAFDVFQDDNLRLEASSVIKNPNDAVCTWVLVAFRVTLYRVGLAVESKNRYGSVAGYQDRGVIQHVVDVAEAKAAGVTIAQHGKQSWLNLAM